MQTIKCSRTKGKILYPTLSNTWMLSLGDLAFTGGSDTEKDVILLHFII